MMEFTEEQLERYSRHIILKEVGAEGQDKIIKARILVVGAGGLGAPALFYLAAAGVGTIGVVDADRVELSNLQRQIIHFTPDLGKLKVESAKEKINAVNPTTKVISYQERLIAANILSIIRDYDFIIDGTDNFAAKFLINDACVLVKKPFSHAGILRFEGQTMTYLPGQTCYRCIFVSLPPQNTVPSCSQAGILGAMAGILGSIQACEAIKYIIGKGDLLTDRLLMLNALSMEFRTVSVKRNKNCSVCGKNPLITKLTDEEQPVCKWRKT